MVNDASPNPLHLALVPTGVPGLDVVLRGGIPRGSVLLVAGDPGTGKTTLGNQLAFRWAEAGGVAVFATLLAETHDRMIAHLAGFRFFDPALIGERVHYISLLSAIQDDAGVEALPDAARRVVRETGAALLIIDGTTVITDLTASPLVFRQLMNRLQAQSALLGCTTVLLINRPSDALGEVGTHADGLVALRQETIGARRVRTLEVVKLRGSDHLGGRHEFAIEASGFVVSPRLEAVFARPDAFVEPDGERLGFGVAALDAMLGGGLLPGSSTLLMGTPGAGKTLTGLHFVIEGARRGEPGVIAGFHERPERLVRAAARIGLDLRTPVDSGLVRILWRPPLELSPDAWAWDLLETVDAHGARRVVVDALTDVDRRIALPHRPPDFVAALTGALRAAGATCIFNAELRTLVGPELRVPLLAVSVAMDNMMFLRYFELASQLRRLVSILKVRESAFDPTIRDFAIGGAGIAVGGPFVQADALLTGAPATNVALVHEP